MKPNLGILYAPLPTSTDVASVSGTSSHMLKCETEDCALMVSANMAFSVQEGKVREGRAPLMGGSINRQCAPSRPVQPLLPP